MFKKVKKGAKKQRANRRSLEEEEEEEEERHDEGGGDSSINSILQAKKKRQRLLQSLKPTVVVARQDDAKEDDKEEDQEKKTPENIWEQRQKRAMEEFIASASGSASATAHEPSKDNSDIYYAIAEKSKEWTGRKEAQDETTSEEAHPTATALLEVILPPSATQKEVAPPVAIQKKKDRVSDGDNVVVVPNRFYVPGRKQHSGNQNSAGQNKDAAAANDDDEKEEDQDRVGFQAYRWGEKAAPTTTVNRATDDRQFKQFVKRQRERRHNK